MVSAAPPSEVQAVSARPLDSYGIAAIGIALFAILARIWVLRATHSTTEDFFITLRYAENIARGHGFAYNSGERVLGTTTPLYTLYLALASWLGANTVLAGKAANILADGITVYLIAALLARLGRPRAGLLAALLYAGASTPINFSIGGMETGLVTLAGLAAIYAYALGRHRAMFVSLAILFLLRIDGLLLAAFLTVGLLLTGRLSIQQRTRRLALAAWPASLIVLPWLAFAWWYFGTPVPLSMLAKITVYRRMIPQSFPNLPAFITQFWAGFPQKALLASFLIGAVAAVRRTVLAIPTLWLLAYFGAMLATRVPAFGWYFMPPLPIFYAVAAMGLGTVLRPGFRLLPMRDAAVFSAGMTLVTAFLAVHLRSVIRDVSAAQRLEDEVRKPIGLWLRANARPGEKVLLEPIGYIGYYSGMRVLDMIGLVSPEVLPSYSESISNPRQDIVRRLKPDVMILRPSEADDALGAGAARGVEPLAGEYTMVRSFSDADNPVFFCFRRAHLVAPAHPPESKE